MKRAWRKFRIKRSEGGWLFGFKFTWDEFFNRKKDKQVKELPKEEKKVSPAFRMWLKAEITGFRAETARIASRIKANKGRYVSVEIETGVPWEVIAVIHSLECGGDFTKHLHNGDRLDRPTKIYPPNRPKGWMSLPQSKRTWERSAVDALKFDKLDKVKEWSISAKLDALERYNGLGYRKYHKDVPTPYLWSGTQFYEKGKYVADGKWDSEAVSKQVGAVPLLKSISRLS